MENILFLDLQLDNNHNNITGLICSIQPVVDSSFSVTNTLDYTPAKGDILYLLPGVNIPRVKLKDLTINLDIKVTRDPDKANIIIAGKNTVGKITDSKWYYKLSTKIVCEKINESNLDQFYIDNLSTSINAINPEFIYLNYSDARFINNDVYGSSEHLYLINNDHVNIWNTVCHKTIFDESELLNNINGDTAIIIDEDMFINIKRMFESSDEDNTVLAMEIMANSNYQASIMYLLMLLDQFHRRIDNSNTKNHVNFKGMLSYFNMIPRNVNSMDADEIIKKIDSKKLLTLDMVNRIYQEYSEDIQRNIYYDDVFTVKQVTLKESYLKLFNSDIKFNVIEDFVPEVTENIDDLLDEDIEAAFKNIEVKELQEEILIVQDEILMIQEEFKQDLENIREELNNLEETITPKQENNDTNNFDWF